jgi:hypothetical protein
MRATAESHIPLVVRVIMSTDEKLIDFAAERDKRIHDINDKRADELRRAFEQVLPMKGKKKPKGKPKKR